MNPRAVRRWLNRLAEVFMLSDDPDPEMVRASGDMVCAQCGADYYSHACDPHNRFLNVLCDGRRVKL